MITMPNSSIASATIVNYSLEGKRRVDHTVTGWVIANDIEKVKSCHAQATAEEHPLVVDKDNIFVRVSAYQ